MSCENHGRRDLLFEFMSFICFLFLDNFTLEFFR